MSEQWTAPGGEDGRRAGDAAAPASPWADGAWDAGAAPSAAPGAAVPPPGQQGGTGLARELVDRAPLFPLRPLGLGEILGAAFGIYKRRPKLVLGVSAIVFGIAALLTSILTGASLVPTMLDMQSALEGSEDSLGPEVTFNAAEMVLTVGGSILTGLVTMVAMQLVLVLLTRLATTEAVGAPVPDAELRAAMRRYGLRASLAGLVASILSSLPFVLLSLLGGVPLMIGQQAAWWTIVPLLLGALLGVLGTIVITVRLSLATPALVTEDLGALAALRRSFVLTGGRGFWRVLGIEALVYLLYSFGLQLIAGVFSTIAMVLYFGILLASSFEMMWLAMAVLLVGTLLGTCAASALLTPFYGSALTALYADLRMRRESWDVELGRAAREARGEALAAAVPGTAGAPVPSAPWRS